MTNIIPSGIIQEMKSAYLDYAMSVIVSRALPDIRDGLKPVHRRILYAMHKTGLTSGSRFKKSATVVGEVLGKYHPHGDAPVYEALVRLAQTFNMRYPLVKGQGNFGSIDGDPPASMRYTEVKLEKIADEMLADIEKNTVDFRDNFDASVQEPVYLPAKLPNLLLMGAEGIAVGMATKIPPHNLGELIDASVTMVDAAVTDKKAIDARAGHATLQFSTTLDDILAHVKGPDFPTRGVIYGINDIKQVYATGRGSIIIRGVADIEENKSGKSSIVITELPYQTNKASFVERIAQLVVDKKLLGISDLRDESDREGIRVVLELKRDATPKQVLNNLYKHTELQTTFPANMVALVNGVPQTLGIQTMLQEYLKHRVYVTIRRSEFELSEAQARAHILQGYLIALDNIDEVVEIIRKAKDEPDARAKLMKKFGLSEVQTKAILDMQLRRLTGLERQKIEEELAEINKKIAFLQKILKDVLEILSVVRTELLEVKKLYTDERKTKVMKNKPGELSDEMLIENKEVLVVLTKDGYIKQVVKDTFKSQHRGGQGVNGMETKESDDILSIVAAQTHDFIMYFTNTGRTFQTRVWEIPVGSRTSKGKAIVNIITLRPDEKVTAMVPFSPEVGKNKETTQDARYIIMFTKNGTVKKSEFAEYKNIRTNGLIAIKLDTGDELKWVKLSDGMSNIMLISDAGKAIMFEETEVRAIGRSGMGVKGMDLESNEEIAAAGVFTKDDQKKNILVIGTKGIGKTVKLTEFKDQHRSGKGVKVASVDDKFGTVAFMGLIEDDHREIVITSSDGQVIKVPLDQIPPRSRTARGVIVMRIKAKDEQVVGATLV